MSRFRYLAVFLLIALGSGSPLEAHLQPAATLEDDFPVSQTDITEWNHLVNQFLKITEQVKGYQKPPLDPQEQGVSNDLSLNLRPNVNTKDSPGGAIYTRWGSSSCINGSELVYSGTVAGSHSTHVGGGVNYLCMPSEPIYDEVTSAQTYAALLYSAEYDTGSGPSRMRQANDHTPTCAVCRAPSDRMTRIMIPGRNVCPSALWRLEYKGYIMASRYDYKKSEFICMDWSMEPEPGTEGYQGGALLFFVETRCMAGGGLPCGPYVSGYEITCAVCTI